MKLERIRWLLPVSLVCLVVVLLAACADKPEHGGQDVPTWIGLTTGNGTLAVNCLSCHGSGTTQDLGTTLSLMADKYTTIVANAQVSAVNPAFHIVHPGDRNSSYLYLVLTGAAVDPGTGGTLSMPPAGGLSSAQIEEVGVWIDNGAPY